MKFIILLVLIQFLMINNIKKAYCDLGTFNAAYGKPTTQSSTLGSYSSSRAVDGGTDSLLYRHSCTHTERTVITYWEVDLLQQLNVSSVSLINRRDCCCDRLKNFTIIGSNKSYTESSVYDMIQCAHQNESAGCGATVSFSCKPLLYTRFIIILKVDTVSREPLTLCEVTVIAECPNGKYGDNCESTCPQNCLSPQSCKKETGACSSCKSGYRGSKCDELCTPGTYGKECSQICSSNCDQSSSAICEHIVGKCYRCELGYIGEYCEQKCSPGKYGKDCSQQCPVNCKSTTVICNHISGKCDQGLCKPGYIGEWCDKSCIPGQYGDKCLLSCSKNCESNLPCDHISGKCVGELCKSGYQSGLCNKECEIGTYGSGCLSKCPGNCQLSAIICNHLSGKCENSLCKPGFNGDWCNKTCQDGTYGTNCISNCSVNCANICNVTDGGCICKEGYTGISCNIISEKDKAGSPAAAAGGGAVAVLVVIIIIVILVIFIMRKRRYKMSQEEIPHSNKAINMGYNNKSFDIADKDAGSDEKKDVYENSFDLTDKGTAYKTTKPGVQVKPKGRKVDLEIEIEKKLDGKINLYENTASLEKINDQEKNIDQAKDKPVISVKPKIRITSNNSSTEQQDNRLPANANLYINVAGSATSVDTSKFESYVAKKKKNSETFEQEYEGLPKTVHSRDKAENPKLKEKNRYKNIYPYDNNTVSLQRIGDDPLSTYINASYIKDYAENVSYIAALGVTSITIGDFWRMIWEQNVTLIVMVTNLIENMKIKCEQYWPTEGLAHYGNITVLLEKEIIFPSYVIRTLKATQDEASRIITQYQYTAWPDKSTPQHLPSLYKIRDVIKTYRNENKVPILVHCSAGVGRTGTLIALDILMDQMENEKQVDINKCVATLRTQRAFMVQTQVQYTYLHDALCEIIAVGSTTIPCSKVSAIAISEKGKIKLREQFHYLERTKESEKDDEFELGKDNKEKNRDMNVIPTDDKRLKLISTPEKYINAVYVSGYNKRLAFIGSQVPLENTVADFWKMILEVNCRRIVFLENDNTLEDWFALDKSSKTVDNLIVTTTAVETGVLYTKYTVSLGEANDTVYANVEDISVDKKDMLQLEIIYIKEWTKLIREKNMKSISRCIEETKDKNSLCTVVCRNGAHHTGVYIACRWLIDMAKAEKEVNIFHMVKTIRKTRPQFIKSLEQYMLLHQFVAQNYEDMI